MADKTEGPRMHHKFDPARAGRLLSPERARRHPPETVLSLLELAPGQAVADIGCGPGYFTLPVAERVGPAGRVVACDVSPHMLEMLRERAAAAGARNVEAVRCEESTLPLPDAAFDRVLLICLLHELAEPAAFLREVARVLRPGGRGVAADWLPASSGIGPPGPARVAPEEAVRWLEAAGLSPEPPARFGPEGYCLAFAAPTATSAVRPSPPGPRR